MDKKIGIRASASKGGSYLKAREWAMRKKNKCKQKRKSTLDLLTCKRKLIRTEEVKTMQKP